MKKLIYFIIAGSLSSCVSYQKLSYIEPAGIDSGKWEMKWGKDPLNIKFVNLTRSINDSAENNIGSISLGFKDYERTSKKPKYFVFFLDLKAQNGSDFIEKFDLNSLYSKKIADSLKRKGVYTDEVLPYSKFYLVSNDSIYISVKVTEFFMGYSQSKYRNFRMVTQTPIPDNSKIKIVTGDKFLDELLKNSFFIFRRKKLLNIQTGMN